MFHIDGKHNLADLLTKKHALSVDSVTLNSVWQSGLPWMRVDTENMPLLAYDKLRVENPIEDEVRVECYDDVMTGEFSQFEGNSVHLSNSLSSLAAGSARVQVNLVVDPVLHGLTKTLRLINYLLALPKGLKHKLHLIPDKNCQICQARDMKWDPTVLEESAEKSLFRYETRVIKGCMKPEQVQELKK